MFEKEKAFVFGETKGLDKNCNQSYSKTDYVTNQNICVDYAVRLRQHKIFDRLFEHLSNLQIRHRQSGEYLPYIFHPQIAIPERKKLENEIVQLVADGFAREYEIVCDVPIALYYDLRSDDATETIFRKRAVCVPNSILNALICEALEKEFSQNEILACSGFCERDGSLRLDLDTHLAKRGFMTPVIDENGLINSLRIFRYPRDERPFILRCRKTLIISEVIN